MRITPRILLFPACPGADSKNPRISASTDRLIPRALTTKITGVSVTCARSQEDALTVTPPRPS